jgi:mTERF domain-containing protein
MLVDGVKELDELGLWASWSAGAGARVGAEMGALGFGRKVYFMGRSRRDGGIVPLVESLGVRLSSAKLIAPYVAAEGLPVLIDRVSVNCVLSMACVPVPLKSKFHLMLPNQG